MPIKVIMKSVYGSHLYGTSTPTSDMDYKQIHMNPLDLILIGKDKGCFNQNTNNSGRNTKDDVDFESKELRTFIHDCLSGVTYAQDLLFTPDHLIMESSDLWKEIISLRHKLVTRNVTPFIGYAVSMSQKYSAKAVKYNELKKFIAILEQTNPKFTFKDFIAKCESGEEPKKSIFRKIVDSFRRVKHYKNIKIDFSEYKHFRYRPKNLAGNTNNIAIEYYLESPDASFPSSRKISEILPVLKQKFEKFGKRVELNAADLTQLDKSYYHALRVVWSLEDVLTNKCLKFPSDRVQHLIDIRNNKYDREYVEEWISSEIERVLKIENTLEKPDWDFWNNWLLDKYMIQAHEQSDEYLKLRGLTP